MAKTTTPAPDDGAGDAHRPARHYPPAKARYRATHPTTGITTDIPTRKRLLALQKRTGLPLGQLMLQGLPGFERNVGEAELRGQAVGDKIGYARGHAAGDRVGYARARKEFELTYPCAICGQPISMVATSAPAKVAISAVTAQGWRHGACHDQRQAR